MLRAIKSESDCRIWTSMLLKFPRWLPCAAKVENHWPRPLPLIFSSASEACLGSLKSTSICYRTKLGFCKPRRNEEKLCGRQSTMSATVTNQHSWFQRALLCGDWRFWFWLHLSSWPISTVSWHFYLEFLSAPHSQFVPNQVFQPAFRPDDIISIMWYQHSQRTSGSNSWNLFLSILFLKSPCFFFFTVKLQHFNSTPSHHLLSLFRLPYSTACLHSVTAT